MNSLHPTQTAQIIQFPELGGSRKFLRKRRVERMARVREAETAAVPLTETCKNARSREGRKGPWDVADVTRHYWRGRLDWESALSLAQSRGIAEGNLHPEGPEGERWMILDRWRHAIAAQLLTPAPTVAAVTWKRSQLRDRQWRYTNVTDEMVMRAIREDVAWLAAHPTRKSVATSRQAKKDKPHG
jgi:hypothetical protein